MLYQPVLAIKLNWQRRMNDDNRKVSIRMLIVGVYLRNEFHFSDVHGTMNHSGSRAK